MALFMSGWPLDSGIFRCVHSLAIGNDHPCIRSRSGPRAHYIALGRVGIAGYVYFEGRWFVSALFLVSALWFAWCIGWLSLLKYLGTVRLS
jgi:hypothetical protein